MIPRLYFYPWDTLSMYFAKVHIALLCTPIIGMLVFISAPLAAENNSIAESGDDFVGIWQYPDKHTPERITYFLKITKLGNNKFQMIEGTKELGNQFAPKDGIIWANPNTNCFPVPNLKLTKNQLITEFTAECFRATHGIDTKYRLTIRLQSRDRLIYSIWSTQDGKHGDTETFQATRVNNSMPTASGKSQVQDGKIKVGLLKDLSPMGCGCYFSPIVAGGKKNFDNYLFLSDDRGNAYMNIDGRNLVLKEIGRKQAKDEYGYCAGKRCTYSDMGVKATVDFRVTDICPPEPNGGCEVTDYDVTISVEKGGLKQSVKGKGSCGC